MNLSATKHFIVITLSSLVLIVLFLIPFHAFLTVWGAQLVGHYTALRLWKEALLSLIMVGVLYLLVIDQNMRKRVFKQRIVWLIIAYCLVNIIWGITSYFRKAVSLTALGYGVVVDLRFLVFFVLVWIVASYAKQLHDNWLKLMFIPFIIVVLFGLLQEFVLPANFLGHFGYSKDTILAFQYVNNNNVFLRIQSTLRGANPFGAYLLIPLSVLTTSIIRGRRSWRVLSLYVLALVALFFSFSRSAFLGYVFIALIVAFLHYQRAVLKHIPLIVTSVAIITLVTLVGLQHNSNLENVILHTQTNSAIKTTSDQGHIAGLKNGLID